MMHNCTQKEIPSIQNSIKFQKQKIDLFKKCKYKLLPIVCKPTSKNFNKTTEIKFFY